MKNNKERRVSDRHSYAAPIVFSYLNEYHCFEAQTCNYCDVGMGFKTNIYLKPGATICIRVKNFHPNKSCTDLFYGLRSVTLADVKWCDEELYGDKFSYTVGVKYFAPCY